MGTQTDIMQCKVQPPTGEMRDYHGAVCNCMRALCSRPNVYLWHQNFQYTTVIWNVITLNLILMQRL